MTSDAFTTTVTLSLALMPNSSTDSLVIDEVTIWPLPISTRTCEVVAPFFTSMTVPLIWLRALMRMMVLTKIAGGRQLRQRDRRFWLWRLLRRLRVDNRILEPIGQIGRLAAFARRWFRLALASAGAGRTFDADMEVVVVAVHRPHVMEPAAVALGFAAQRLLDRGIDEDALHARFLRRRADHREMARRPGARIDIEPVGAHHHDRGRFLALFARQSPVRHRRQPDIGVEAHLVAGVPGQHWAAARLRHIADQYSRPPRILVRLVRQSLEQRDQVGMPPVAIARQSH